MILEIKNHNIFAVMPSVLAFSFATLALSSPVLGQDSEQKPWKVDGHVIYSRDVPYGTAMGPRTPGREHSVNTGPTDLMLDTIATGLQPMADDENAGVVASTNFQFGIIDRHIANGLNSTSGRVGSSPNIGGAQSAAAGKAIGQVNGAFQNAMNSLRTALGGNQ